MSESPGPPQEVTGASHDPAFEALLRHLKEARGFDFTGYKRGSLERRFRRRMAEIDMDSFEAYLDHLQVHPDEFGTLFDALFVNVTGFFRDRDAWDCLREKVLPKLLERRGTGSLRVWSAGCASGEEAYSLAMLLSDLMGAEAVRERVKIYATDVDDDALAAARQATYAERELRGLEPDEVRRFFDRSGERYAFRKELRRSVIFGRNDLVQDAPISRVDLLVCRNTLIYLNADTQAQTMRRLHFALRPDGILFLGKAEMLLSHAALFAPVDLRRRIFRKVPAPPDLDRQLLLRSEPPERPGRAVEGAIPLAALLSSPVPQLVVDAQGRLALSNHRADTLLGLSPRDLGRPFQDLEVSYRPIELRSRLEEASRTRQALWIREIEWQRLGAEIQVFDVQVVPLLDEDGALLGSTVVFHDVTRHRQLQTELEFTNRQLETAYEELQSTNEELETTNEELQSTNEELETTNEELQSTNEELETMNDELQAMNDELHSSNTGLNVSTLRLEELNAFTESVLSGLHSGVAVVDRDLVVLAWNDRAVDLWGVRRDEAVGRPLLALDIGLPVESLRPLLGRQMSDGQTGAHETLELTAVNRRGRDTRVRVTVTPLPASYAAADGSPPGQGLGAILVMDETED